MEDFEIHSKKEKKYHYAEYFRSQKKPVCQDVQLVDGGEHARSWSPIALRWPKNKKRPPHR